MDNNDKSKKELATRINLVRRDMSNLLFHFTKRTANDESASDVLNKILNEGKLRGTSKSKKSSL
jgi:hypothetical protein